MSTTLNLLQVHRQNCTTAILNAKKSQNVSWEKIAKELGRSPVWVTSCCLGENSMDKESADKLLKFLGLGDDESCLLTTLTSPCPIKGQISATELFQDPLLYRLHEINLVYGLTIKELIQEKFGDGIMSAIDFEMEVEKEENPQGDRVKIIMSGKFLPYRKW